MAKSFKQLVSEVAQPKGGDEKAFKDQHTIQKFNHPVALDHQFTGEIDKERKMRPADYTAPADASAYDKATGIDDMGATLGEDKKYYDGFDSNGVTHRDAEHAHDEMHHYYKSLDKKGKKGAAEAAKHHTDAASAHDKAHELIGKGHYDAAHGMARAAKTSAKKALSVARKHYIFHRDASAAHDDSIRAHRAHSHLGEDVEQIDELKKSTYGSYIKKAGPDAVKQDAAAARHDAAGMDADKDADMYKHYGKAQRAMDKAKNRRKYINKAVDKLTNESQKKSLEKKLAAASAPSKKGKEAVTLPKAPWDKMKEATEIVLESREMIDEAVRAGNMRLKDGSSVKIKNEDAKLLNQMFKDLNSSNRRQMEKVMMTDKAGFEEILGFAKEAL